MKISEVSQEFGIPQVTLRFLEQKGLLRPARNKDNQYREYNTEDLSILLEYLKFRRFGIPLKHIDQIISSDDLSLQFQELDHCRDKLEREIYEKQLLLECLKKYQSRIDAFQSNQEMFWFEKRPAFFYTKVGSQSSDGTQFLSNPDGAAWRQGVPYVSLMYLIPEEQLKTSEWAYQWYLMAESQHAREIANRKSRNTLFAEESLCLCSYVRSTEDGLERDRILEAYQKQASKGYSLCGPVMVKLLNITRKNDFISYCGQVFLPVRPEQSLYPL